ncbi:histidine phosphatase family protein [Planctomycetota bacterium]
MNPPIPESTNRYFILRHGFSQANEMNMIVSNLQRGKNAFGLTDKGRAQVTATVTAARDEGRLDAQTVVVSSPFLRAVETAEIATEILGIRGFQRDDRLRERFFGTFELMEDKNYQAVWDRDRLDPNHTQWQVESVTAEVERMHALLTELSQQYQGQTILLIAHGDIASMLLCWAAGEDLRQHREVGALETAGLAEVSFNMRN